MKTFIGARKMLNMWQNFASDGLFQMCRQLIVDHLLLNPVEFVKNKRAFDVGHEFRDTFDTYWKPFTKDAVDQLLAFGFVVVEIMEDDAKRKYPRTVHPSLVNIAFNYETREYEINDRDAVVYGGFGFDPLEGRFTSLAAKVMPKLRFLRSLRDACSHMEHQKRDPCYFSEVQDLPTERREGIDFEFYANEDDVEDQTNSLFNRNKAQVDLLKRQQELFDEQVGTARAARGLKNVIQMPSGHKLISPPIHSGRNDLVQIHKVVQEEVCSTLGVPRSLLIGDSMYRSDTEGVQELFRHTIMWWQSKIQQIETDLYQVIYFDPGSVKLTKNIYAAKQRYQVHIHFPLSPFATTEELTFLYQSGVITWQRFSTGVLRNASLPIEILEEPQTPEEPAQSAPQAPQGAPQGAPQDARGAKLPQPPRKRQRASKSKLTK